MAIDIHEFTLPWTPEDARWYIQNETDNFGVFFDVDRCYELMAILQREDMRLNEEAQQVTNSPFLYLKDKDSVITNLMRMGVDADLFKERGKTKPSLNAKVCARILQEFDLTDDAKKLIDIQQQFSSNERNIGYLEGIATLPNSVALSKYGHRMSKGNPLWRILSTSRLAASDPGVQGIPRSMPEILTEPCGYTLIRCDSAQIEPCINFSTYLRDELIINLITYYKDAYKGILHYCLMNEEQERLYRDKWSEFVPMQDDEDFKAHRQQIKRLTNAGSYGSSNLGDINPRLAKLYEQKLVKHPARLALERKVTQDVQRGVETFYGMFGTPVTPDETEKYHKSDDSWTDHVIRCGINNPVQTTASELMIHSIHAAKQILEEAKDTHICFYKHDEAIFYVSDEDMANGIGDKLSDITAYNVDGWIPIRAEAEIGVKHGSYPSYILGGASA